MFSTQDYSTVAKIPLTGSHLYELFDSPAELNKCWQTLTEAIADGKNRVIDYYIYGIRFVALIKPILPGLAEIHETRYATVRHMYMIHQQYKGESK